MISRSEAVGTARSYHSLERILRALVHSNVFIALAAASWVVTTAILVDVPVDPIPLGIVFFATLFVYSVNRFTDIEEDSQNVPERAAFTKRYGWLSLSVGILGYLGAVALAIALDLPWAEALVVPLVAAVIYSISGLKRRLLVKNVLVGLAWGAIPFGVGVYVGQPWSADVLFLSGYVAAMLTIAAIIFDIKDIEGDQAAGIRTVPTVYGPSWTRRIGTAATGIVALAVVATVLLSTLSIHLLAVLAMNVYVGAYAAVAPRDAGPLFYGFVVDGEHLFLAALVVLAHGLVW